MSIKLPSYLHRNRHGVFGFRVTIPRDVRVCFSAHEYRITLKTSEKRRAKHFASGLTLFTATCFENLRRMRNKAPNTPPIDFLNQLDAERERLSSRVLEIAGATTPEAQRAVITEMIEAMPQCPMRELGLTFVAFSDREEAIAAKKMALVAKAIDSISDNPENVDAIFCDLYAEAGELKNAEMALFSEIERHRALLREIRAEQDKAAVLEDASEEFAMEREKLSDFASQIIANVTQNSAGFAPSTTLRPTLPPDAEKPLAAVIEAYCANQKAEGSWTEKTEQENRAIFTLWLRIIEDQPIGSYNFDQHRTLKSKLLKLPPNLNKTPRYRGRSIDEIIALGDKTASHNTINKALTRIAAFFKWAVSNGYTDFSPAGNMNIKNPKRANEERQAFTDDDLRKLFNTPEYLEGKHSKPYMHWAPLIALYTGARINEIAQLHIADFRVLDDIAVISINDDGETKRLKTKACKRLIPIHSELIRLGLLQYVERLRKKRIPRLFPELEARRDGYGQTVSKWFGRYRERCQVTEEGKVFHSFRHTVIDQLKQAGIAKEKIAALAGHEDESVTLGRYGKDFRPAVMFEVVEALSAEITKQIPRAGHITGQSIGKILNKFE